MTTLDNTLSTPNDIDLGFLLDALDANPIRRWSSRMTATTSVPATTSPK